MAINFTDNHISSINLKDVRYNIKSIPLHGKLHDWNGENEEANNLNMHNYIPKDGEIIVIDVDGDGITPYRRIKIGDGINTVNNLPNFNNLNTGMEISSGEPALFEDGDIWIDTSEDANEAFPVLKVKINGKWVTLNDSSGSNEIDSELSLESENPVQNKVVANAIDNLQNRIAEHDVDGGSW